MFAVVSGLQVPDHPPISKTLIDCGGAVTIALMQASDPVSTALMQRALALRRTHPQAPALDVLDQCLRGSACSLDDFGPALDPRQPFGLLIAEALDGGMSVQDWKGLLRQDGDPAVIQALMQVWREDVLPRFAARYAPAG
jgi:hypothetical protein